MSGRSRLRTAEFKRHYDMLPAGKTMVCLAWSTSEPVGIVQALKKSRIDEGVDYQIKVAPVLSPRSFEYLCRLPGDSVKETELKRYRERSLEVFPDKDEFPALHKLEKAIDRMSNKSLVSDTLPRVSGAYQVYIRKLSNKKLK